MLTIREDPTIVLETGGSEYVRAVAFHPDGMHLWGGSSNSIRRWQLADGRVVGKKTGMKVLAISVSKDGKCVVCGTREGGASVWDAELHKKVINVEGTNWTWAVDISPDSTRIATGTDHREASIWNITSGERLVGPLIHARQVTGIRFSPNGEQVATCCESGSVRIFDSRNGDQLIDIKTITPSAMPITPIAWSNDGEQIFTISDDKVKSFAVSTGSQLAESPVLNHDRSLSLAGNGKFIATATDPAISFLDTSSLTKIGTVNAIDDSKGIWSIAISSDGSRIAAGRRDGKIIIYNLANLLPLHVSICPFIMLACRITTITCRRVTLGVCSWGTTTRRAFSIRWP